MLGWIWLAAALLLQGPQLSSTERTITLGPGDAVLEGHGPFEDVSYTARAQGTLFVYALSDDAELLLQWLPPEGEEEGAHGARPLAEDDGGGGTRAPFLAIRVEKGEGIRVRVAAKSPGGAGKATLRLIEAPETEATRAAAARAAGAIREAERLEKAKDPDAARKVLALVTEDLLALPGRDASRAIARWLLRIGDVAFRLGDRQTAASAWGATLDVWERTLPRDHPRLQRARLNLAEALERLRGRDKKEQQRALLEKVLEVYERTLLPDDRMLQNVRLRLANVLGDMEDYQGSKVLEEKVLEVYERTLSPNDPELQRARGNYALTIKWLGDLQGARALQEKVLEVYERTLPPDHLDLWWMRTCLDETICDMYDILAAKALEERIVEVCERTHLPNDYEVQKNRLRLSFTIRQLGDLEGARALQEKVLAARERKLPPDDPELQRARLALADTIARLGDVQEAKALDEKALEVFERTLRPDHPYLRSARGALASRLKALGDLEGARALQEKVLEMCDRAGRLDDADCQWVRWNLALTRKALGDLEGARALQERVLAVLEGALPPEYPGLDGARRNLLWTTAQMGDAGASRRLVERLARGATGRLLSFDEILSPREIEAMAVSAGGAISAVLSVLAGPGRLAPFPSLEPEGFALVETARGAAVSHQRVTRGLARLAGDESAASLRREIAGASREVARLSREEVAGAEVFEALRRKEKAQRALREHLSSLPEAAAFLPRAEAGAVAAALAKGEAAVGYWRYVRSEIDRDTRSVKSKPSYLAYVIRKDGPLRRVELGPAATIEKAVHAWREAIEFPERRGVSLVVAKDQERERGKVLRRLVFDPLRPHLGGMSRVVVALDDALYSIPLDALPEGDGDGVLGERFRITYRSTLKELTLKDPAALASPSILAIGGIEYDVVARAGGGEANEERLVASLDRGAPASVLRSRAWERSFAFLPSTGPEVETVGHYFRQAFGKGRATLLEGAGATRRSFEERAPRVRFLHLATHAYFAPESIPSMADGGPRGERAPGGSLGGRREEVTGYAPMVLCGLAFAGANGDPTRYGRIPGVMTAEELSGLDLGGCELAVLSACETNVGVRRAGQGIASLQQALEGAGVRSTITSLWKVPDEATRELMGEFYRRLWVRKEPKARALWGAKMRLRAARSPDGTPRYGTRDWAGWVLTGDPN